MFVYLQDKGHAIFSFSNLINFEELLRVAEQWVVGNQDFRCALCLFVLTLNIVLRLSLQGK